MVRVLWDCGLWSFGKKRFLFLILILILYKDLLLSYQFFKRVLSHFLEKCFYVIVFKNFIALWFLFFIYFLNNNTINPKIVSLKYLIANILCHASPSQILDPMVSLF